MKAQLYVDDTMKLSNFERTMNLTTMTMNALRCCAIQHGGWEPKDGDEAIWEAGPPKALIASIHYNVVKATYSLGKLGLSDVVKWLAQDGLIMPGTPDGAKRGNVRQSRLDAAADLLRRHGYKVEEPNAVLKRAE